MKILVDTSVWSLALRRSEPEDIVCKLTELIRASLVVMIGPIKQELLSGISNEYVFLNLKSKLAHYDDLPITSSDYETAAEYYNLCRSHGIQGSHVDFLICAVAVNNDLLIFTIDQDFKQFTEFIPISTFSNTSLANFSKGC